MNSENAEPPDEKAHVDASDLRKETEDVPASKENDPEKKNQGDVNQNTIKKEDEDGHEKQKVAVDGKTEDSTKDTEWTKTFVKLKKRKYRSRAKDDEKKCEKEDENVENEEHDMDVDGESHEKTDDPNTSSFNTSESIDNPEIEISESPAAETATKSGLGNLKRSKHKPNSSAKHKKRKKAKSKEDPDSGIQAASEAGTSRETESAKTQTENDISDAKSDSESSDYGSSTRTNSSSSSTSPDNSDNEEEERPLTDDEVWLEKHTDKINLPSWTAVKQLMKRECGCRNPSWKSKVCGSNGMVRRLDQQYTLDAHEGCVNALHFNQTGTLLASGSDDLDIHIWDWVSASQEPYISYASGHRSNVFQAKFMPNSNDLTVISCARDGQVRVGYLSSTGTCRDTKKIAQHRGSAHKLALDSAGCKSTFLSCGEDSVVMGFDLRENKPGTKLVSVKKGETKVALYSIDTSPRQSSEFAVSGRDQWARVYDRRMLNFDSPETVAKYCPHHLQNASDMKANVTCLVYNYDGSEILCSYNDEDIYLFDTNHSDGDEFARKYKGHRNNATVKGVNFYGPRSEFIVSGSDCGNIFFWDKASSQVVQFMQGDDGGVVNVLEPHPNLPVLATSGLDKNIKIWGPTGDGTLDDEKLKKLMLSNRQERHDESNDSHVIDSHLLWFLMRSLRNARNRRRRDGEDDDDSSDSSSSGSSESDDDGDGSGGRRGVDCLAS